VKRTVLERIQDIRDQINHILEVTKDISKDSFSEDIVLQTAIIRWLEVIGEATKHVPMDIREKYNEIPWKKMAGMRDVAIHDYADLNILRIWKTV